MGIVQLTHIKTHICTNAHTQHMHTDTHTNMHTTHAHRHTHNTCTQTHTQTAKYRHIHLNRSMKASISNYDRLFVRKKLDIQIESGAISNDLAYPEDRGGSVQL